MSDQTNQLANLNQFNMQDLQKRISESVQATFGMLMPEDAFKAMTEKAVHDYFHKEQTFGLREVTHPDDIGKQPWQQNKITVLNNRLTMFELQVYKVLTPLVEAELTKWLKENEDAAAKAMKESLEGPEVSIPLNKGIAQVAAHVTQMQAIQAVSMASLTTLQQVRNGLATAGIPVNF